MLQRARAALAGHASGRELQLGPDRRLRRPLRAASALAHAGQQHGHGAGRGDRQDRSSRSSPPSPSSISAFPLRMTFFWVIFVTLMLPVEVRIVPTYGVVAGLGMLDSLFGPDHPADRLGHRDLPVPPVLPERARRADRGGARRRRRAAALLLGHPAADEPHLHRGPVRDPVHLRLEPVSVAAADHDQGELLHRGHDASRARPTWPTPCRAGTC